MSTTTQQQALTTLKTVFGYDQFRAHQSDIIDTILQGDDAVVLMPTGSGKSLCYQLPALLLPGLTIVISPLISLMQDQVSSLRALGVAADVLNSSLTATAYRDVMTRLEHGQVKLLYVAPERLATDGFLDFLRRQQVSLIAIDEAHCISEWGHDFRPDYRNLACLREAFSGVPIIALTATATSKVLGDIRGQLQLQNARCFSSSFNRANLFYEVRPKKNTYQQLLKFIQQHPNESGIIYCQSRKQVESTAEKLNRDGIVALPYHAGLGAQERRDNQAAFVKDDVQIIVATIAFGMGIHKPDVRFVLHQDLPKTIENYYQETGRAGRDGLDSRCILFYSYGDKQKIDSFNRKISDPHERRQANIKLNQMVQFAFRPLCRRRQLLQYFGESFEEENCQSCDACVNPPQMKDVTILSQKILSTIYRVKQRFGMSMIADVLKGDDSARIRQLGFDRLSVYGIEEEASKQEIRDVISYLGFLEAIAVEGDEYPILKLTQKSMPILRSETTVTMPVYKVAKKEKAIKNETIADVGPVDNDLFESLRVLRKQIADDAGVPPFVVFHDSTLKHMAALKPKTLDEMLSVNGVGQKKLESYGMLFLARILD